MAKILCSITIAALLMVTTPITLQAQEKAPVKIGHGRSYNITAQQLAKLKTQEGLHFYETLPNIVPSFLIAVTIPEKLGGGYLVGNKKNIAKAFNAAGITVGLTASAVSKKAVVIGGVAIVALAGFIIAAVSGDSSTTHQHP